MTLQKERMQNIPFFFSLLPDFCIFIVSTETCCRDLVLNFMIGCYETQVLEWG